MYQFLLNKYNIMNFINNLHDKVQCLLYTPDALEIIIKENAYPESTTVNPEGIRLSSFNAADGSLLLVCDDEVLLAAVVKIYGNLAKNQERYNYIKNRTYSETKPSMTAD